MLIGFRVGLILGSLFGSTLFSVLIGAVAVWWFKKTGEIIERYEAMIHRLIEQRDRPIAERDAEGEEWKRI